MSNEPIFPVLEGVAEGAWADAAKYREMYRRSVDDPEGFWGEHGKCISRDRRHRIDGNIRTQGGGECAYYPRLLPG